MRKFNGFLGPRCIFSAISCNKHIKMAGIIVGGEVAVNDDKEVACSHPDGSGSNKAYQKMKKARIEERKNPNALPKDFPTSMGVRFTSVEGNDIGPHLDLPVEATQEKLEKLVNQLQSLENDKNEAVPYAFYIEGREVLGSVGEMVVELGLSTEASLKITCQPLAIFKVRPVTRCGETLPGHSDAVLHVSYSPDGSRLASGSGDTTVSLSSFSIYVLVLYIFYLLI